MVASSLLSAWAEEPSYWNKPLSYWVLGDPASMIHAELLGVPDVLDLESQEAVKAIGTNAIPFLISWIEKLHSGRAVTAFGVLGPTATSAIPNLLRIATNQAPPSADENVRAERDLARVAAIRALGGIGPAAIPALCEVITNRVNGGARCAALDALTAIRSKEPVSSAMLLGCMRDADTNLVREVLIALPHLHLSTDLAKKELFLAVMDCYEHPTDHDMRYYAFDALAAFGEDMIPVFIRAMDSDDVLIRVYAVRRLGPLGRRAVPWVIKGLNDRESRVRDAALDAVVNDMPLALTNSEVLALGANRLKGSVPNSGQHIWASLLLRAAGQQARGQKPDLMLPLRGGWNQVYQDATNALKQLAPELLQTEATPEAKKP
jgi:HEAT repeat protein